ncbi:hypothetical protein N781_03600 [Pontibacillus halophilus JSM 076056 = DSM 19796]|uniref:Spo0E like sporulation regulatory protein n=1 Tax=Pontibacillus halophilus JSM 076056 = DSM 19796 TaxID=1385510 RepID=A0A0A5GEE6_9BACI|nr:aspartyl-phosphate phosphatase Spo0E family protein [Pontibacillus halophilus]KGX91586.1 hypothetical protein N781_03600 [Pontibacillus halophilus JSM 076056 = DSM 19796]
MANHLAHTTPKQVRDRIERLRREMIQIATVKGLTSMESLAISKELDDLLNLYEYMKTDRIDY